MNYDTGRTVLAFFFVIGWFVVAGGIFFTFGGLASDGIAGMLLRLPMILSGFGIIAASYVGTAAIDTAENTKGIKHEISQMRDDFDRARRG